MTRRGISTVAPLTRGTACRLGMTFTVALALAGIGVARADYQVSGRFLYRDRGQSLEANGFTGIDTDKPIRFADVEVVDGSLNVLATTATNATGNFSVHVVDSQVHDIYIRVLTSSVHATPSYRLQVEQTGNNAVFALVSPTYAAHASNVNIDFTATPVIALQTATASTIGEPFNIFDMAVDAFDFINSINGGRPARLLTLYWARGSAVGTYYRDSDASIFYVGMTNDSDGYDDAVILHEIGHYTEFNLANSNNPGGQHTLNGYYDLRLSWSEGWATFFSNSVRNWRGTPRPEIYVDTAGQPGPGQAFIAYEVETPSVGSPGADNEVSVNAALWDITDTSATADATPATDDDALGLADGPAEVWRVMKNYITTASSISLEDFWDGWFSPAIANGHPTEMRNIFAAQGIEYFPDAYESDGTTVLAKTVVAGTTATHRTTYGVGDQDWTIIGVVGGALYTFGTTNLMSGADTQLDLYASNGTTLVASNDDRVVGDPSSLISYTPPNSAVVYLRCKRKADPHTYGSYDLVVTGPPVPVDVTDVSLVAAADGIHLQWRAQRQGAFSHFEVERGTDGAGPWTTLATASSTSGGGDFAYVDAGVEPGKTYFYRIVGVDATGQRQAFGPFAATAMAPAHLALHAPQPNPFNPTTSIRFELPRQSRPVMRVYSASGRLVRTLLEGVTLAAGTHAVRWDGLDGAGGRVASGVYLVELDDAGQRLVKRAVMLR